MGFVKDAWNGITGKSSAKAAKQAGKIQADASRYAANISQKQYEQTRQDQMPWLRTGQAALKSLSGHVDNSQQYTDNYGTAINSAIGNLGGKTSAGQSYDNALGGQINDWASSLNRNGNINPSAISTNNVSAGKINNFDVNSKNIAANNNIKTGTFDDSMRSNMQSNYDNNQYTGGLSLDEFEADPSYQWRKQQGMDGIQSSAAASGGLLSGAALKALNKYNSNLASQEYGNAWQRNQAQKQQQFAVDSNLRGQDHSIFTEQQARQMQADLNNASLNQQAQQFNSSQDMQAQLSNQANRFNTQAQNVSNDLNAQLANQSNDFNAQSQNVSNQLTAQTANQNYGLNALQALMSARNQDYGLFADQRDREMQAEQFNINNNQNTLAALMNARSQDYSMFSNEDARLYNQLANLAGVGQQTANSLGVYGAQNAATIGDAQINAANARAYGLVGGANARSNGMGNLLGLGVKAAGMFI